MRAASQDNAVPDLLRDLDLKRGGPGVNPELRYIFINRHASSLGHALSYLHCRLPLKHRDIHRRDWRSAKTHASTRQRAGRCAYVKVPHSQTGLYGKLRNAARSNCAGSQAETLAACLEKRIDQRTKPNLGGSNAGCFVSLGAGFHLRSNAVPDSLWDLHACHEVPDQVRDCGSASIKGPTP